MHIVRGTNELSLIRELFREYADSLEFSLDAQNFEQELIDLPGQDNVLNSAHKLKGQSCSW